VKLKVTSWCDDSKPQKSIISSIVASSGRKMVGKIVGIAVVTEGNNAGSVFAGLALGLFDAPIVGETVVGKRVSGTSFTIPPSTLKLRKTNVNISSLPAFVR
jgi:hypothetical protein